MSTKNQDFLEERKNYLAELSQAYYEGAPLVDDATFDRLQAEYVAAGGQEVVGHGYKVETGRKVVHNQHMGSLKKVKAEPSELVSWLQNRYSFYKENCDTSVPLTVSVSPKFDGLAAAVTVENGQVKMVATRGDGYVGENITQASMNIKQINSLTADGLYSGEIMLPKESLSEANKYRNPGEKPLVQVRNAAAGIVRRDPKRKKRETDANYDARLRLINNAAKTRVFANHNEGEYKQVFTVHEVIQNLNEILDDFEPQRTHYPVFPGQHVYIDGVVFKVEGQDVREGMGISSGSPRWARAYKYADDVYQSTITGVEWRAPGKIGHVTPVLLFDNIEIAGANHDKATAHNIAKFVEMSPHLNDKIDIIKSGEVIPYVVDIIHMGDGDKLPIPTECPTCQFPLAVEGKFLVCTNNRNDCNPARALTLIIAGLGIKGLQEKIVQRIYDAYLTDYNDMHEALSAMKNFEDGKISQIEGMGSKTDAKVKKDLDNAWNNATLAQWIYGLNVKRVGNTVSQALETTYGSLDAIIEAIDNPDKYREVENLKGVNWASIVEHRERFVFLRDWIQRNNVAAPVGSITVVEDDFWGGKKVALTGSLGIPRAKAEEWLKAHGAQISGSFDILIDAGDGTSSKSVKARQKGKQVMLGTEFVSEHYNKN